MYPQIPDPEPPPRMLKTSYVSRPLWLLSLIENKPTATHVAGWCVTMYLLRMSYWDTCISTNQYRYADGHLRADPSF